jgi:dihydroorotate dehydrogenase
MADVFVESGIDGVIATNTTIDRVAVAGLKYSKESGGLSGGPLTRASTELIAKLAKRLNGELPIIGVGGILSGKDAVEKIDAGASLVQIYTGFIYRGPALIREAAAAIRDRS